MRTNDEIFNLVISRRDGHKAEKSRRTKQISAVGAAAVFVCIALAVTLSRTLPGSSKQGGTDAPVSHGGELSESVVSTDENAIIPESKSENGAPEEAQNQNKNQKNEKTFPSSETARGPAPAKLPASTAAEETTTRESVRPESVTEQKENGYSSGTGSPMIPVIPAQAGAKPGINITGEKITDSEAKAYFDGNKASISSALTASGVPADGMRISEAGYSHVSYDGTEGKQLELRQNFRDYLVYNGDGDLIAIITLYKENGKLYNTPAFGAPWFPAYNAYLNAHKGQQLLYVYAGPWELIIAPDGTCSSPSGSDASLCLEGVKNPYQYFFSAPATYTP